MGTEHTGHRLAVVGAGVMGTNITTLALGHGVPVVLVDVNEDVLATARDHQAEDAARPAAWACCRPTGRAGGWSPRRRSPTSPVARTVVEAVVEVAEEKEKVLTEVSGLVRRGTTLISNTSCIPIDEMAAWVDAPRRAASACTS